MFNKDIIEELGGCIVKQFPDEGVYRISRVEEWLNTNGYTMDKLGISDFHELTQEAPELFGKPRFNEDTYVILRRFDGSRELEGHPADSFFGSKSITLNDDIIEMSQQSLYALTKVLDNGVSVQEMKQEIYDAFADARDNGRLLFLSDRYVFPVGYCTDGCLVNGIVTKNISPRGKSLYFSFEKTNIFSAEPVMNGFSHRRTECEAAEISEQDKENIYKLLTAAFPFDIPQHMAAVSKLLADNHFERTRFGFYKMKDMLMQLDFLELEDVVLGGVPQVMITLRQSDKYTASTLKSVFYRHSPEDVPEQSEQPVEIPDGELEDFCNLPPKPLFILSQYLEKTGSSYTSYQLREELCEDFRDARLNGKIRFYEGKILFPTRFSKSDGTPVEITLKRSTYDGKPWFLSFVDTVCRDPALRVIQPGRRLESFAFLGSWKAFLTELAEKALPENWDFSGSNQKEYHILIQYIKYTFYRLIREDKVCISSDRQFACFNTGLVDCHYEDIYACFLPNDPDSETEWKFSGFCTVASRTLGKQIVEYFSPLPQPPVYYEHGDRLFFDTTRQLLMDYTHIIIDNVNRLPLQFLYDQFIDHAEARELVEQIKSSDFKHRHELYQKLRSLITENNHLFTRIQNRINYAVDIAKKRASRNYKIAVPSYYPKRNTLSLMLPLCLVNEDVPDVALVIEQTRSRNYQGHTILTLSQAYVDARLLCPIGSDWLNTNIILGADEQEQDDISEDIAE